MSCRFNFKRRKAMQKAIKQLSRKQIEGMLICALDCLGYAHPCIAAADESMRVGISYEWLLDKVESLLGGYGLPEDIRQEFLFNLTARNKR
jgi:hypothetical protein